ncbi:hypothetical protein BJY14_007425 [Actinomadura luteofluorescens]|uniref:Uncharacterized protein n=1 Tax=Actinomadura luteofluorescens TaxID=46163 RepID=A0A7Y9JJG4_9ACTN|nr:hypothetical protein [Actinomadura luteofluorescens]
MADPGCGGHLAAETVRVGPERAGDDARGDGVHADAARRHLLAEPLPELDQRRLGLRVADWRAAGHAGVDRGDVHDRAPALQDARQRRPGGPHRAEQVEVEHPPPLLVADVEEPAEGQPVRVARADVVDEEVDPADRGERLIDDRRRPAAGAQVDGHGRGGGLLQLGGDGAGGAHHPDALRGQGPGDREADAATRAGDQSGPAADAEIHDLPFVNRQVLELEVKNEGAEKGRRPSSRA